MFFGQNKDVWSEKKGVWGSSPTNKGVRAPRDVDFDLAVKKAWLAFGLNQGMFVFGGIYIFSELVGEFPQLFF